MSELKELLVKRSSIKGRLTKFKNYLNALAEDDSMTSIEIGKLTCKLSNCEALFKDFDTLQDDVEILNAATLNTELLERDLIEQDFYHCIATARDILDNYKRNHPDLGSEYNSIKTNPHDGANDLMGFGLPVIKIPNFDGAYYRWLEFRESFNSLVHTNDKIKNIHKFYYLNSYLEGEAARIICN